jgi:serine/threonine protein kinase
VITQSNSKVRLQLSRTIGDKEDHSADRLTQALEEYSAAIEAGQPIARELLLSKYSDIADELQGCLDSLAFIREVAPQLADQAADPVMRGSPDSVVRGSPDRAHPASSVLRGYPDPADLASTPATLGDFRIVREIGRGGMGVVYEAEQLSLGRRVALKVLPFAAMLDRQQLARFKNEARAAATLDHPNIVAIHSVGCERGVHYYAMQLIEGQSLAEVVEQVGAASRAAHAQNVDMPHSGPARLAGPTDADTAPIAHLSTLPDFHSREYFNAIAQLGIQAAEALDHAHQNGILHRDIKPANLLVDDTGKLWITDFGLARLETDAGMTMTGDILGTLRYMSPEQALAKRAVIDHRSDIYSLGVTLYELLTGRPAFDGTDRGELLRAITEIEPPRVRTLARTAPTDLETIVHKAMEKVASDRYSTAGELAADLRRYLEHRPIIAQPPSLVTRSRKWLRRHTAAATTAVGVLVLAVIALAIGAVILNAKKNEADANLRLAAEAVDQLLFEMGREASAYGQLPQAERILGQAARFYQQFVEKSNDAVMLCRAATARNHIGALYRARGRHELAIEEHQAALALLNRTGAQQDAAEILEPRATAYDGMAIAYMNRINQESDAHAEFYLDQSRALRQQLVDSNPGNIHYVDELIRTLNSQAVIYMDDRERLDEAEATYRLILELSQQLPAQHSQSTRRLNTTAIVTCNLGTIAVERGRLAEAEPLFRQAITTQEKVVALKPGVKAYEQDLYKCQWNLVDLFIRQGKDAAASAAAERLVEQFRHRLDAHYAVADLLLRCAELADAASSPLPLEDGQGEGLPGEGSHYRAAARQLIATADDATERTPDTQGFFAWFLLTCRDKSLRDPTRALALADAALAEAPDRDLWHQFRGIALYRLRQYPAAIDAFQHAATASGTNAIVDVLFLAMSHWQLGNQTEAQQWYAKAANWFGINQSRRTSVYDIFAAPKLEFLAEANALLTTKPTAAAEQE